jgi:hypothetical protein
MYISFHAATLLLTRVRVNGALMETLLSAIIFKHYPELASEEQTAEWFEVMPKEDQFNEVGVWKHRKPRRPRKKNK